MAFVTEDVYADLFDLTVGWTPSIVKTRSRVLKLNFNVDNKQQPALYQVELAEDVTQLSGTSPIWRLRPVWIIYVNRGENDKVLPSTLINPVLDAVRAVFRPPAGIDKLTLNGQVTYCRIAGPIDIDEGVLGQQAIIQVPIEILAPEDLKC